MLLVGGITDEEVNAKVEVLDLIGRDNKNTEYFDCNPVPDYPCQVQAASGGLLDVDPVICGGAGLDDSQVNGCSRQCYAFQNGVWKSTSILVQDRIASSAQEVGEDEGGLLILGGQGAMEAEIIALGEDGEALNASPEGFTHHCSVKIDAETILVIGGITDGMASARTFYYNISIDQWFAGPSLNSARSNHACGILEDENVVVVVGGEDVSVVESVELLDLDDPEAFTFGNSILMTRYGGQLVQDPGEAGGLILVGGTDGKNEFTDLLRLKCSTCFWEELPIRLREGRRNFVAVGIPEYEFVANCTRK